MIKLVACALAAVSALCFFGAAQAQDWPGPEWSHLEVGDWDLVTEGAGGTMFLMRPARGAGVRFWTRAEYLAPSGTGYRSMVSLVEFDCAQDRMRFIQTTFYEGSNMSGTSSMLGAAEWTYATPGSVGAGQVDYACGRDEASQPLR